MARMHFRRALAAPLAAPLATPLATLGLFCLSLFCLSPFCLSRPAAARDLLFWNMTEHEMVGVYLARPGTRAWGPNLALSDTIDYTAQGDERIRMPGVVPGQYDAKLVDKAGQTCIVANVTVKGAGKVALAIEEDQLTHCTQ